MIYGFNDTYPKIHGSAHITPDAIVIGDVEIGEDSSVWFGSVIRGDVNYIRIGARTNVQDMTMIHVSSKTHCTIVHGCHIESGCLIGIGAILMDGVRVGANSLVGAGSLLTPGTQIPPNSLVIGSPARVKRELTPDEIGFLDRSWRNYVELKEHYK